MKYLERSNGGEIIDAVVGERDEKVAALESEVRRLKRQLTDAQMDAARAREDATRALAMLRKQLGPLYRALQAVFGELDAAGIADAPVHEPENGKAPNDGHLAAVWDNWKTQLPGYPARIIDALLLHANLNTAQLAIACGCKRQRISEGMVKLKKAGLVNKEGDRFSLKSL